MANNRFKVDNGITVTGNAEFYQRIDAFANAHFKNDLFVVSGNLTVNGTLIFANVVVGNGGIRSVADQQDLGNTTNRFNLFGYRVQIDDTLVPLANGVAAGNTTRRFEVFANNLNATTITVGSTSINATYFDGTAKSANTINGLYANGFIVRTGNTTAEARTITTGTTGINITNGNGVSGNPSIDISFQSGLFANTTGVYVNASSIGDGTLPILRGGTGGPDRVTGLNNLLPTQNAAVTNYVLRTNGTDVSWVLSTGPVGFTGSIGAIGFTGSIGSTGFTGSAGTNGFWGSAGGIGFSGSRGFSGSAGGVGFTGSSGLGYSGSAGTDGFSGSRGFSGSAGGVGFTGSGGTGFTGSAGTNGFSGSRGFSGSAGGLGFTGSVGTGFTGSAGTSGFTGSKGSASDAVAPILRHVTTGFTNGGQVFVTNTTPRAIQAGVGTITTATNSNTVTGTATTFDSTYLNNTLFAPGGVTLGTVSSVTTNTSLALTSNALFAVTGNTHTYGIISALTAGDIWIDTAGTSGYSQSLASNGWTKLPNGVIFQWGTVSASPNASGQSGTFPIAFTAVARAVMNGVGSSEISSYGTTSKGPTIYATSTTGFTYMSGEESTCTGFWLAMGY